GVGDRRGDVGAGVQLGGAPLVRVGVGDRGLADALVQEVEPVADVEPEEGVEVALAAVGADPQLEGVEAGVEVVQDRGVEAARGVCDCGGPVPPSAVSMSRPSGPKKLATWLIWMSLFAGSACAAAKISAGVRL